MAGDTNVNLAIQDEVRMAHLCNYVMVHTATSMEFARQGHPMKKQYGLKAGFKRFGPCANATVTKELSQLHTMNCVCPCDPHPSPMTTAAKLSLLSCFSRKNILVN